MNSRSVSSGNRSLFSPWLTVLCGFAALVFAADRCRAEDQPPILHVPQCADFAVNGQGDNKAWEAAEWTDLNRRGNGAHEYATRIKMLYSSKGLYVLFDGADKKLTASLENDFENLWNEDVFEAFFWTDERFPVYFEYEISPLGRELPIIIPNLEGKFYGWRPWHYEGDRKTRKAVAIFGGEQKSGAAIDGWRAEVFFPYELLTPLQNSPPQPGTRWRANFYRVDYDDEKTTGWDWARVGPSFHEYEKFGTLIFEPDTGVRAPQTDIKNLKLRDWAPKSMLVTKETQVPKPKFPVIDVHNHLGGGAARLTPERVDGYLRAMDDAGVQTVVNLDGGWDKQLEETLAALDNAHPGRFLTFALLDFRGMDEPGWTEREVKRLRAGFEKGAKGLKLHKSLGLYYRYADKKLATIDDPKLDPIWELCGKYKRPVMIHTSDPAAFFTPLDRFNERWHELNEHPNWLFFGDNFPSRDELLAQRNRVIERHPNTTFIGAHFGNNPEDVATVGQWLDKYPNFYVDIDARISELGRQPYTVRRFFLKYQDRILFGTDTTPRADAYRIYYRFLETDDEYFDPAQGHHRQGFWMIYGIFLPDDVLEKLYRRNAEKILFGLNATAAD